MSGDASICPGPQCHDCGRRPHRDQCCKADPREHREHRPRQTRTCPGCGLWQLVDGADTCSDTCPRATNTRLPKELTS